MNRLEFERIAMELLARSGDEITNLLDATGSTSMQVRIVARLLQNAGNGDTRSFESLMNRLHGRTRQESQTQEDKPTKSFVELVMEAEAAEKDD